MTDEQIATMSAFTVAQLNTIIDEYMGENDLTIMTANFVQMNASNEAQYYCATALEKQGDIFVSIMPDGDYACTLDAVINNADVVESLPVVDEDGNEIEENLPR
jgi:hypothetical protein